MRWFIFRYVLVGKNLALFLFFLISIPSYSQIDSLLKEKYKSAWNKLIPTQVKWQYAGDMGTMSIGAGWDYGRRRQWETNLFVGYLSASGSSPVHVTATLKQTYAPFRVGLGRDLSIQPITAGFYMNKVFGQYFWSKLPDRYPRNYYFWILNTRFNVFLGQSLTFYCPKLLKGDSISLFYEFNTNDLYVISAIGNRYIGLKDIVNLSFGAKFTFL